MILGDICKINLAVFKVFNMRKWFCLLVMLLMATPAFAQMSSLTQVKYLATLKVVANYKMGDQEIAKDLEKLRESEKFKKDLEKMMAKLDNSKSSNAVNRRVMKILEQAGKDIYNELK